MPQYSEELVTAQLRRNASSAVSALLEKGCRVFVSFCRGNRWCRELIRLLASIIPSDPVHGLGHTIRVACLSFAIGDLEYQDLYEPCVLAAAALLHDVGRQAETESLHHAVASARAAPSFLAAVSYPCRHEPIVNSILEHSFSLGKEPSTLESCILSDADKIDALGCIGIYRMFYFSGLRGRDLRGTLDHYRKKIRVLPNFMCTNLARELAHKLLQDMECCMNVIADTLKAEQVLQALQDLS